MKKIIVAIDGPAGSGKSSVSKEAAISLRLKYIDSGAIYRALTWFALERKGSIDKNTSFDGLLDGINLEQRFNPDGSCSTFVNQTDVSELIRTEIIAKNIGFVSDRVEVRSFVTALLRKWGETDSILMDGRDIGTVVFPHADLKIYMDASVDVRAGRRHLEYLSKGKNVDLNDIKKQIILRDEQDKGRAVGGLKQAHDAVYFDTSDLPKEVVVEKLIEMITDCRTS